MRDLARVLHNKRLAGGVLIAMHPRGRTRSYANRLDSSSGGCGI